MAECSTLMVSQIDFLASQRSCPSNNQGLVLDIGEALGTVATRSSHHGSLLWAGSALNNGGGPDQQGTSLERCHALDSKDTASGFGLPIWTPLRSMQSTILGPVATPQLAWWV